MTNQNFKIDRSQRMHSGSITVRVYQVFGTEQFGWDTNREQPPPNRPLHDSKTAAERDADENMERLGHVCDDGCYPWRLLG